MQCMTKVRVMQWLAISLLFAVFHSSEPGYICRIVYNTLSRVAVSLGQNSCMM